MSKMIKVPIGKKMCTNCFKEIDENEAFCMHCGYEEEDDPTSALHISPGTILNNRYIIGRTLGYGGYGVTYLAYDQELERRIAIKEYLPSEFSTRGIDSEDLIIDLAEKKLKQFDAGKRKFMEEGKKLAQVSDIENVVHMYDCFEENNTAYITMEYLQGMTLEKYLEEHQTLSEEETLGLMLPLLGALSRIHEKGIIHRDIAPDNIFITNDKDGKPIAKLIDFGSAKFAIVAQSSKSLTTIFKQGYSPEEQYSSRKKQGSYTDIYSVAAVMYKMLTGIQVPDAMKRRLLIESGKRDPIIPITKINKNVSRNVEIAVMNACNVKVEDRTQTAGDFAGELVSFEKVKRIGPSIHKIDFFKWPLWAKIGVPLATVASIALIVFALNKIFLTAEETVSLPMGMTRVPEFISDTFFNAQEKGDEVSIMVQSTSDEYTPGGKSDIVLSQNKDYGVVVPTNSIVGVTVSTGKQIYPLPDVNGMDIEYARYALECMGLEVLVEDGTKEGVANGVVIQMSEEPYTEIESGSTITLTVNKTEMKSSKSDTLDPKGLSYEELLKEAINSGVLVSISDKVYTNKYKDLEVISYEYNDDNVLEVVVAIPEKEFTMPNLVFKNHDIAVQLLKNMGLEAKTIFEYSDIVAENLVYKQSKEKNTTTKCGEKITLNISQGSKPETMPSLHDLDEKEAIKILEDLKLAYTIEYSYSKDVKLNHVISQSISSGDDVRRGDEITIVICSDQDLISVPNVTGKSSAQAKASIEGAGLKVQIVETNSDTVGKGVVISQLPVADSKQEKDAVIVLTVSKGPKANPVVNQNNNTNTNNTNNTTNNNNTTTTPVHKPAGEWSEWGALPSGVTSAKYDIEQRTEYRQRTRETKTSTNSYEAGWTLYNQSEAWSDWSSWSNWTTSYVSSSESTKVETSQQYQYVYENYEYTESTSSSLSGWERYSSYEVDNGWGAWSGWSDNAIQSSSTRQVETRQVEVSAAYTQYRYGRWQNSNGTHYHFCPQLGQSQHGGTWSQYWTDWQNTQIARSTDTTIGSCGYPNHTHIGVAYNNGTDVWYFYGVSTNRFYFYETRTIPATYKTQYRYCDKQISTVYKYRRKVQTGTSDWTFDYNGNLTLYDTRSVYRYATRSKQYTYYYERWSDWSNYTTTKLYETGNNQVQTRVRYRYRTKAT